MDECGSSPDQAPSTSSDGGAHDTQPQLTEHKVCKLDSLAGLAIRYNVTVSDIRRQNGLASDIAMYGRQTLMIPRARSKSKLVGEDVAELFAQLVSGIGRDAVLHSDQRILGGTDRSTLTAARIARTLKGISSDGHGASANGEPPQSFGDCPWMCTCCAGGDWGSEERMQRRMMMTRRRDSDSSADAAQDGSGLAPECTAPGGSGPTRLLENMRRRRGGIGSLDDDGWHALEVDASAATCSNEGDGQHKQRRAPRNGAGMGGPAAGARPQSFSWRQLAGAVQRSALVQRIAAAAAQPALATPGSGGSGGFGAAADAILTTRGGGSSGMGGGASGASTPGKAGGLPKAPSVGALARLIPRSSSGAAFTSPGSGSTPSAPALRKTGKAD